MTAPPLQHLRLPMGASFAARIRGAGRARPYRRAERDHEKFRAEIASGLERIARSRARDAGRYDAYGYAPAHIFRMHLTQDVARGPFKAGLESVGIGTVSSALGRQWMVEGSGDYGKRLVAKAEERIGGKRPTFVDAIGGIDDVPPEEKMGRGLCEVPPGAEMEDIDVETWPMPGGRLERFALALDGIARERGGGGGMRDAFQGTDYCAIRVRCNASLLREIASMPEVSRVSRPPKIRAGGRPGPGASIPGPIKGPDPGAPGILVADSGIAEHPLLDPAVAGPVPVDGTAGGGAAWRDDAGHGTAVAGIAAYGDVQACADRGAFEPKVRLYSAKVLERGPGGGAVFRGLIDGKIEHAVDELAARHPSCRIVNLSLGDSSLEIGPGERQPRLASLVDRLSASHKGLVFVVSAGNIMDCPDSAYPHYLLDGPDGTRMIDPATSAHAITVGAIFQGPGCEDHPAPYTRVGPGLAGMAKPDVVDYGGGYDGRCGRDVLTTNWAWRQNGKFALDSGTSMSAPKVAHTLALLDGSWPGASRNLLKALLVLSAEIPTPRPAPIDALSTGNGGEAAALSRIYGHGKPDLGRAMHSSSCRAVLVHEGSLRTGRAEALAIRVPSAFVDAPGRRTIAVSLAFDPPTDGTMDPYLGAAMKFYLYKNTGMNTVRRCYEDAGGASSRGRAVPDSIKGNMIRLVPGVRQRMSGTHQKSWATSGGSMGIDASRPLVLVVVAEKRWAEERDWQQEYAVAVSFEHSGKDIYDAFKSANAPGAGGGAP